MPSAHLLDDVVRVGGPDEGLGVGVGLGEEAVDRRLQLDQRAEHAALEPPPVSLAKRPSTALSHEAEVGVKWKVQRGCRASHARTLGCLWVP